MSDTTATNLFMYSPFLSKYAEFYQGLLQGVASYQQLGNRLIQQGEQAHAFRQFDKVKEIGQFLSNIPIKDYQAIGHYFLAVAANSKGNGDQEKARKFFEIAANTAPDKYRGKAIMSLAALAAHKKDYANELYFFQESLKAGKDLYTILKAHKGIAVIQAREGYHKYSLKYLESFLPLIRYAEPHVYFDYLNSYAVELGEAGRKEEARNVIRHVIASPFIHAYPEWRETAQDLKEPSRSFVSVPSIETEPVEVETIEAHHASEPEQTQNVIAFPALKEAPQPQKPDRLKPQEWAELNAIEKRELILAALRTGAIQESEYDKLVSMVGLLKSGPADNVLDLEDQAVLDDLIIMWSHQIDPEELVAVLSALRDCDDSIRRNTIIDRMIRIAFEETQECGLNEEAWRLRVERRLPKK